MNVRAGLVGAGYRAIVRPLMFASHHGDPEAIHEQMIGALARASRSPMAVSATRLLAGSRGEPVTVAGIDFPGRVGLAAGMDKDGRAVLAWQALGFSFAELGTVTAHAQPGNPRPRVFRLPDSSALINRMGFHHAGALALANRLPVAGIFRGNRAAGVPLGISIGKTKATPVEDAVPDYLTSLRCVAPHADYVAINVSSPNTPGLRGLQEASQLAELLGALTAEARALARGAAPVPIFVKVAPDLSLGGLDELVRVAEDAGAAGLIATNTTLARDGLAPADQHLASEAGGLSGAPLTDHAREVVAHVAAQTSLPVIASGGIMTVEDALAALDAGAALVQLYTGFIYGGPALIAEIEDAVAAARARGARP